MARCKKKSRKAKGREKQKRKSKFFSQGVLRKRVRSQSQFSTTNTSAFSSRLLRLPCNPPPGACLFLFPLIHPRFAHRSPSRHSQTKNRAVGKRVFLRGGRARNGEVRSRTNGQKPRRKTHRETSFFSKPKQIKKSQKQPWPCPTSLPSSSRSCSCSLSVRVQFGDWRVGGIEREREKRRFRFECLRNCNRVAPSGNEKNAHLSPQLARLLALSLSKAPRQIFSRFHENLNEREREREKESGRASCLPLPFLRRETEEQKTKRSRRKFLRFFPFFAHAEFSKLNQNMKTPQPPPPPRPTPGAGAGVTAGVRWAAGAAGVA